MNIRWEDKSRHVPRNLLQDGKPLRELEDVRPTSRSEYEAEAVASIVAPFRVPAPMGSHELQLIREHKLQQRFFAAVEEMKAAIAEVNRLSSVITIDGELFDNLVHDEMPSLASWQERLGEAS